MRRTDKNEIKEMKDAIRLYFGAHRWVHTKRQNICELDKKKEKSGPRTALNQKAKDNVNNRALVLTTVAFLCT